VAARRRPASRSTQGTGVGARFATSARRCKRSRVLAALRASKHQASCRPVPISSQQTKRESDSARRSTTSAYQRSWRHRLDEHRNTLASAGSPRRYARPPGSNTHAGGVSHGVDGDRSRCVTCACSVRRCTHRPRRGSCARCHRLPLLPSGARGSRLRVAHWRRSPRLRALGAARAGRGRRPPGR
jgi:hypothetical protein